MLTHSSSWPQIFLMFLCPINHIPLPIICLAGPWSSWAKTNYMLGWKKCDKRRRMFKKQIETIKLLIIFNFNQHCRKLYWMVHRLGKLISIENVVESKFRLLKYFYILDRNNLFNVSAVLLQNRTELKFF